MRKNFLDRCNDKSNKELVAMWPILYQTNLIIERFYIPNDYDNTGFYWNLRRCILSWLKDSPSMKKQTTLNELKWEPPNEFGHLLPKYFTT